MYQLVAEVLDHAPANLTAAEVLILVAIGEETRARGEYREIPVEDLARRARLDRRGLRVAVARLAKNGITVRVALGVDRRGKPLYAVPGKAPRWVLPAFPPPPGCGCRTCRQGGDEVPPQGGTTTPPTVNGQVNKEAPQIPHAEKEEPQLRQEEPGFRQEEPQLRQPDAPVPPSPYVAEPVIYQRPPTVAYLINHGATDDDEAHQLIKTIKMRFAPRSVGAYIRSLPADDLAEMLDEIRTSRRPASSLPPQCGQCGPNGPNRQIEINGTVHRCPTCHPLARTA